MGRYDKILNDLPADAAASERPASSGSRYSMDKLFPPPPAPPPPATPTHVGSILPFTTYSDKSVRFEPFSAGPIGGLLGAFRQGADYANNVYEGKASSDVSDPRVMGNVLNMATLGAGTNPFVRSGDRAIPGVAGGALDMTLAKAPTSAELKAAGGAQLNAVRDMPVRYDPASLGTLADSIEQDLVKKGIFPESSKQLYKTLDRMRAAPEGAIAEPANLMSIRENMAKLFERPKEHQAGVGTAFERLNQYIENPPTGAVLAGPAAEVGAAYAKGRANYAAGLRGEELADIQRTADLSRSAANSGQNLDNSLRQRVKSLVLNDRAMRGFTPAEETALEAVPTGTPVRNALRGAGNFLGGGGGLGASTTAAMATGLGHFLGAGDVGSVALGMAAPAVGAALKGQAARGTRGALQAIEEDTRRRSPLFQESLAGQDLVPTSPGRDAIARRLMQMELTPQDQQIPTSLTLPTVTVRPNDLYDPENQL